ncbi:hypothetical protein HW49_02080 [Porphyromonadaceae bacterium COT-184 OH4590]|nr:hypothetical protein HW49_02080 [Porphyromonadaceae bacterium COT-184 OH4590]
MKNNKPYKYAILVVILAIVVLFATKIIFFRIDLTEEKRFSISKASKDILRKIDKPINVNIYLGEADANIAYLRNAVADMLDEFSAYANHDISYRYINPANAKSDKERNDNFRRLEERGLSPITISTRDAQGKVSQTLVFPWAEVMLDSDTLPVSLMKPTAMKTGEASVNAAVEELEYNFIEMINILSKTNFDKIAFLEGHGELSEIETYSIMEQLRMYFQIDRGTLADDASILTPYKAIVIAKPTKPFSESDKYIIDQYIMNGGKVLWLLDAINYSSSELSKSGISPVLALDLNLNDMLFRYGARLETTVVQDLQCLYMPINVATVGEPPVFEQMPFTYSPLLMTSPENPITKNLMNVKADFPSFVQQVSLENGIDMEVILATSNASHVDMAPTNINLKSIANINPEQFVNAQFLPVGVLMQGKFESIFRHRQVPNNLTNLQPRRDKSEHTKMIIVADGDIARNEIEQSKAGQIGIVPLGLDRNTGQSYGNSTFIINSLLSITDDDALIQLRNRTIKLRMLDKQKITSDRVFWQLINTLLPVLILTLLGAGYVYMRKVRYR